MKDQRRLERFQLDVPARISLPIREGEPREIEARTRDISSAGAFLLLEPDDIDLHVGTHVEVELMLIIDRLRELLRANNQVEVSVEGKIRRTEADGVAVVFTHKVRFHPKLLDGALMI